MDLSKIAVILNPYVQSYTAELRGAGGRYVTALTKAKKLFLRIPRYKKAFVLEFPAKVKRASDRKRLIRDFMKEVLTEIEMKRRKRRDAEDKKRGIVRKKKRSKYPIKVASTPTTEVPGEGDVIIDTEEDYREFSREEEETEKRTIKVKPFKLDQPYERSSMYKSFHRAETEPYEAISRSQNIKEEAVLESFKSSQNEKNYFRFDATLEKMMREAFKDYGPGYYQAKIGVKMKIRDGRTIKSQEGISAPRILIEDFSQLSDVTEIPQLKSLKYALANYLTRAMSGKIQLTSLGLEFISEKSIVRTPEDNL